jgi:undecaprenyl-diphosphatase
MVEADRTIFLFLNSLHSPLFDQVMWVVSMKTVWIPLYGFIIWLLAARYGKQVWVPLVLVPVLVVLTDQGSTLIKNLVERPRPCHEPDLAGMVHTVRGYCGGMYGFVSGHAANTFGIAAFTIPLLKKRWFTLTVLAWAFMVSYSRIYLGVHYPGDVAGGALLGLMAGAGLSWTAVKILKRIQK